VSPDAAAAAELATAAGELLVDLRRRADAEGLDQQALRAEGDRRSHDLLMRLLHERFPDDAVLSEEGDDDPGRLRATRTWIVDPLDGTREYGMPPRDDWAVHVALVVDGAVTDAAVALPAQGVTLASDPAPPPPPPWDGPARVVVSQSRPPAIATAVADALGGELVSMGSAGAKAMAVVQGKVDVYVHDGGQYEWDSAAPVGVAAAAGLHVSRIDGSPLRYNRPDPWLPDLLICRPELAERVLELLARPSA
jgi:3'(2'), 5'-bisphosphate nucleotidase